MSTKAGKAYQSIRNRQRPCRGCDAPIAMVSCIDAATGDSRVVLVDPDEDETGWVVITRNGPYVDDMFQAQGRRWRRHVCTERSA